MKKLLSALVLVSVGEVMADAALPKGSYQGSCKDCTFENNVLKCTCKDAYGSFEKPNSINESSLEINPGDVRSVGNDNGVLIFALPRGDYQKNCFNCRTELTNLNGRSIPRLTCECCLCGNSCTGHATSINIEKDNYKDIYNVNGWLHINY